MFEETPLDRAISFRNALVALATGGGFAGGDDAYRERRIELSRISSIRHLIPDFVRRCDDTGQFWNFIKYKFPSYSARREFLWDAFRPMVTQLEAPDLAPGVEPVSSTLDAFDAEGVREAWQKALDRRVQDPEGAITAARSLLETVCKHVLDDSETPYPDDADLPRLWRLAAAVVNLAPSQHQEPVFREILGGCQSIVGSLGALRNKVGDAHGQGRRQVKPKPRHAELAVNLAGAMASFMISTWMEKSQGSVEREF